MLNSLQEIKISFYFDMIDRKESEIVNN